MKPLYFLLLLFCYQHSNSQTRLTVGDKVPDMMYSNVINYKKTTAKLYDFKGKLTILDFWSGYCSSCLRHMPELDSMQRANSDKLNILLISGSPDDTKEKASRIMRKLATVRHQAIQLPVILGDTQTFKYFPARGVPHYIWINEKHIVVAITGGDDATPQNIAAVLKGEQVNMAQKDILDEFDIAKPLFVRSNGGDGDKLFARSSFSRYIPGLRSTVRMDSNRTTGLVTKITATNMPLVYMLMSAHYFYLTDAGRAIYPRGDTSLNIIGKSDAWVNAHSYCYELIIPPTDKRLALKRMQDDIRADLGIRAKQDSVLLPCYNLVADTSVLSKFRSKNSKRDISYDSLSDYKCIHATLKDVTELLDQMLPNQVFNETGVKHPIDIVLPSDGDFESVNGRLAPYGLRLEKSERKQRTLVFYKTE